MHPSIQWSLKWKHKSESKRNDNCFIVQVGAYRHNLNWLVLVCTGEEKEIERDAEIRRRDKSRQVKETFTNPRPLWSSSLSAGPLVHDLDHPSQPLKKKAALIQRFLLMQQVPDLSYVFPCPCLDLSAGSGGQDPLIPQILWVGPGGQDPPNTYLTGSKVKESERTWFLQEMFNKFALH